MDMHPRTPLISSLRSLARAVAEAASGRCCSVPYRPENTLPWLAAEEIIRLTDQETLVSSAEEDRLKTEIERLRTEVALLRSDNIRLQLRIETLKAAKPVPCGSDHGDEA